MNREDEKVSLLHDELPGVFKNQSLPDEWADGFVLVPGGNISQDIPEEWAQSDSYDEWQEEKEEMRQAAIDRIKDDEKSTIEMPTASAGEDGMIEDMVYGDDSYKIPFRDLPKEMFDTRPGAPVIDAEFDTETPADAWACYFPFHEYYPDWWGIYITMDGINEIGSKIYDATAKKLDFPLCKNIAKDYLFYNEQFHSNVENYATHLELTHRKPLYVTGFRKYYVETYMKDSCLEEALADVHTYEHIKRKYNSLLKSDRTSYRKMKQVLFDNIKNGPPGYKSAADIISDGTWQTTQDEFLAWLAKYCFQIEQGNTHLWSLFQYAFSPFIKINYRAIYLTRKGSRAETRMGISGRYLRYNELTRKLQKNFGIEYVWHGKGSHEIWQTQDGKVQVPIPRHPGDLGVGLISTILKQFGTGMNYDKFIRA
jgi:predicted RNA binding protein YcfA (HicA-like mRNA interferase family)